VSVKNSKSSVRGPGETKGFSIPAGVLILEDVSSRFRFGPEFKATN
jgi:hypothetical protein